MSAAVTAFKLIAEPTGMFDGSVNGIPILKSVNTQVLPDGGISFDKGFVDIGRHTDFDHFDAFTEEANINQLESSTETHMKVRDTPLQPIIVKAFMLIAAILSMVTAARADTWRGTAPFCSGQCLPGETKVATSNCGNGACCWTGYKVLCKNKEPSCAAKETNTTCYGIVMVCDNGHYVGGNPPSWVSCSKYVCGMCFGLPW